LLTPLVQNGKYMFANMVPGGAQAVHRGDGYFEGASLLRLPRRTAAGRRCCCCC